MNAVCVVRACSSSPSASLAGGTLLRRPAQMRAPRPRRGGRRARRRRCRAPRAGAAPWARSGRGRGSKTRSVQVQAQHARPARARLLPSATATPAGVRRGVGVNPERRLNLQLAQGDVEWSVIDESRAYPAAARAPPEMATEALSPRRASRARYTLRFRNLSGAQLGGDRHGRRPRRAQRQARSLRNGGYVLRPLQVLDIEGFREEPDPRSRPSASPRRAAPMPPTPRPATRRNIGILGAALFQDRAARAPRRPRGDPRRAAQRLPADGATGASAPPPRYAEVSPLTRQRPRAA